jgi:hypothetical protein
MGRARRDVILNYVDFVAAVRVLGFGHLLKGTAPSIERMIGIENARIAKLTKAGKIHFTPLPPMEAMILSREQAFRSGHLDEELEARVRKWAPLKKEALANG